MLPRNGERPPPRSAENDLSNEPPTKTLANGFSPTAPPLQDAGLIPAERLLYLAERLHGVRTRKCTLCPVHKNKDGIQRENQCRRYRRRALAGQIGRRGRKTWTRRHVFTQGLSCKRVESSENSAQKNARGWRNAMN